MLTDMRSVSVHDNNGDDIHDASRTHNKLVMTDMGSVKVHSNCCHDGPRGQKGP